MMIEQQLRRRAERGAGPLMEQRPTPQEVVSTEKGKPATAPTIVIARRRDTAGSAVNVLDVRGECRRHPSYLVLTPH